MLSTKEVSEYKKEIEQTLNRINKKTNRIETMTKLYLRSVMRKQGFEESVIAEALSC